MRRLLSFVLVCVLLVSLAPCAFAASDEAVSAANALYALGLFNGTGTGPDGKPNFDLDRTPTRHESITMLVRLLGKETEAKSKTWSIPFTDVADWAKPYVGYAYANGLTNGTSDTTYDGDNTITASQYLTLALRALGYKSGSDFQWDRAWELSDNIGLTAGQYNEGTKAFTRGDVAIVSNTALDCKLKDFPFTLRALLPGSNEPSGDNLTPENVRNRILDTTHIGFEYIKDAVDEWSASWSAVFNEDFQAAVRSASSAQLHCAMALNRFNASYTQCGDYDDAKILKAALKIICNDLEKVCSYDITYDTIGEFLGFTMAVLGKIVGINNLLYFDMETL